MRSTSCTRPRDAEPRTAERARAEPSVPRWGLALAGLVLAGCNAGRPAPVAAHWSAAPWPAADALLRRDLHWVGGDGGYSIDLGQGRVLWLFGDSFIDPTGEGRRGGSTLAMVSNTLAVQEGYDPSAASIRFHWSAAGDGRPAAFFPDEAGTRFWPGHGVLLGDRLILFLMRVRSVSEGLGFEVVDWEAVLVTNPDAEPSEWERTRLATPASGRGAIVGSAGVFVDTAHLYAHASEEPGGRRAYLVRWPVADVRRGDLGALAWWDGADWTEDEARAQPVVKGAGSEFTVHRDPASGDWLLFQTIGFGPADLARRHAPRLSGPWSEPHVLYRPPEFELPRVMLYQGKAHPGLEGAELVATYCSNSFEFGDLFQDTDRYYPRFVRLTRE